MSINPFAPAFENLPSSIPVFPLTGVLLLPGGQLPLNIFEQRYLDMIDAAMGADRLIGMIQPEKPNHDGAQKNPALSKTGCVGKITDFSETADGRYVIALTGVCRFEVGAELETTTLYRQVAPNWQPYKKDLDAKGCIDLDRERLNDLLQTYFVKEGLDCDWSMVDQASDEKLITCLSMICPFDPQEKQALLEATCCNARSDLFLTMLEMSVQSAESNLETKH